MTRCECQGGPQPACDACLRRARAWRCCAYLIGRYGKTYPHVIDGDRVSITLADGRTVTARVDIDRDRVVEVPS